MSKQDIQVKSSGGVLFYINKSRTFVALVYKENYWVFPKGQLEKNENSIQAAKRELREELSLKSKSRFIVVNSVGTTKYQTPNPDRPEEILNKQVNYYLFLSEKKYKISPLKKEGFKNAEWLNIDEAKEKLSFDNDKKILEKAIKILRVD